MVFLGFFDSALNPIISGKLGNNLHIYGVPTLPMRTIPLYLILDKAQLLGDTTNVRGKETY